MTIGLAKTSILAAGASVSTLVGGIGGGWLVAGALLAWRRAAGVAAAAVMGTGVSLYLGRQHHPAFAESACNINEVFNCDVVNTSAYSELFGIPVALLGTGFYVGCFALAIMASRSKEAYSRAGHLITVGGLVSVLYSAFLGYQSSLLGAWCLFCISLYGVNAIILAGGLWMVKDSGVALKDGVGTALLGSSDRSMGTMMGAGAVALIVAMFWYRGLGPVGAHLPGADAAGNMDVSTLVEGVAEGAEMDGTEPIYGDPSAPYTVLEWADFECPHCGIVAPELKQLVNDNPDIRLVFRNYPLDRKCNTSMERDFHKYSCDAAFAAECAVQQGKFWEFTGLMFKNQDYLDPAGIRMMADQRGLDVDLLEQCLADPATEFAVKADISAGEEADVSGTPAFFLQGAHGEGKWVRLRASPAQIGQIVAAHRAAGKPLPL
jgi:protein-disulfide isomerase/uncharacterized membrane protein